MTAATGHDRGALLLQSTAVSANVVFISIDWKVSRHGSEKAFKANMSLLGKTMVGVVRNMNPTMI